MGHPTLLPTNGKTAEDTCTHFSSVVVRMIKNPLTNIALSVEALDDENTDGHFSHCLSIIKHNSERISNMINVLITFNELTTFTAHRYTLPPLIDEVLQGLTEPIQQKKITIIRQYDSATQTVLFTYPQMKKALTNIILNAIDAMPLEGQLKLSITMSDGHYRLFIEDNGTGIDTAHIQYMFTPFFTANEGRLGLGLTTAHALLSMNHVKVEVSSTPGEGTHFILTFPWNA